MLLVPGVHKDHRVTVRKDRGTFHGDTLQESHSGSMWDAGFAGPWALG